MKIEFDETNLTVQQARDIADLIDKINAIAKVKATLDGTIASIASMMVKGKWE